MCTKYKVSMYNPGRCAQMPISGGSRISHRDLLGGVDLWRRHFLAKMKELGPVGACVPGTLPLPPPPICQCRTMPTQTTTDKAWLYKALWLINQMSQKPLESTQISWYLNLSLISANLDKCSSAGLRNWPMLCARNWVTSLSSSIRRSHVQEPLSLHWSKTMVLVSVLDSLKDYL